MIKKANPTLEGQLLEYLESAPDDKSEVMWNVLQHLRARQRGDTIENPTIEGRIAEFFETAPLEKAEVLFNIIELKLGKRIEKEAQAAEEPKEAAARAKKTKPEPKGKAKPLEAAVAEPAPAAAKASLPEPPIEARVKEPVMVPVEEIDRKTEDSDESPVMADDVA